MFVVVVIVVGGVSIFVFDVVVVACCCRCCCHCCRHCYCCGLFSTSTTDLQQQVLVGVRPCMHTIHITYTRTNAVFSAGAAAARASHDDDGQRLAWLLGLACHRDASVRSLAMGVVAELAPTSSPFPPLGGAGVRHIEIGAGGRAGGEEGQGGDGIRRGRGGAGAGGGGSRGGGGGEGGAGGGGGGGKQEEEAGDEVIRACVRAASDVYHESPAVVSEALRFLSR